MGQPAGIPRRLAVIHDSVLSMRDQLDNLRAVASLSLSTPMPCAVDQLTNLILREFAPLARDKNIALVAHLDEHLPHVWATPDDLRLAVRHLIANAVHYTDPGGEIKVRARAEDRMVLIEVSDTGVGIPPELLGSIFEMFYKGRSGDERQSGWGWAGLVDRAHGRGDLRRSGAGRERAWQGQHLLPAICWRRIFSHDRAVSAPPRSSPPDR
jgi:signal transduction histidine kinase